MSGRLNQGSLHALLSILLLDVAGQSHGAGALPSGVVDIAKIVQCSTFQHLRERGREREKERERGREKERERGRERESERERM